MIALENLLDKPGSENQPSKPAGPQIYNFIKIHLNVYDVRTWVTIFNPLDSIIANLLSTKGKYYQLQILYTRWPILIYNPKYLFKYFIYEKMLGRRLPRAEGDIWLYHRFWPWDQFSRSNGGKTLFLDENPCFWLRIWKERKISRHEWPVE